MNTTPLSRQYNPATYTELGIVKIGSGLMVDNSGEISLGWSITATAGEGGSISPAGTVHVKQGESQTYTITPNENYDILDVIVDNVSQGAINEYEFADISEEHTISVTFKEWKGIFRNGVLRSGYTLNAGYTIGSDGTAQTVPPNSINVSIENSKIKLSVNASGGRSFDFVYINADLTNISTITAKYQNSTIHYTYLQIFDKINSIPINYYQPTHYAYGAEQIGTLTLDVSMLSGEYSIGLCSYFNSETGTLQFSEVLIE